MELLIPQTTDFAVDGTGNAPNWQAATWQPLQRVGEGVVDYPTKAKVIYSATGLYFLVDCVDQRLTCTMTEDYADIYREDVVEVFLWPHEPQPLYFEYEISPLGVELPIMVPNFNGAFMGWRPWHYEGPRLVRRAATVRGGPQQSMASISGWTVEFFIPFALFTGLGNAVPKSGSVWRANMYRIDYDQTPSSGWAWAPKTARNFHDYKNFGTFRFA